MIAETDDATVVVLIAVMPTMVVLTLIVLALAIPPRLERDGRDIGLPVHRNRTEGFVTCAFTGLAFTGLPLAGLALRTFAQGSGRGGLDLSGDFDLRCDFHLS